MITILPKINVIPPVNGRNSQTPQLKMNGLKQDTFSPSFGSKVQLPLQEIKNEGIKCVKNIGDSIKEARFIDVVEDYVSTIVEKCTHSFEKAKFRDHSFAGDFFHELSGSYIANHQLNLYKLDKDKSMNFVEKNKKIHENIKSVVEHVNNTTKLYQFFLDNNMQSKTKTIGADNVFNLVLDSFKVQAKEKNIELKIEGFDILKKYSKSTHSDFQNYIIESNLLANAIKYSPENSVINMKFAKKGDKLHFSIEDMGIGVPKADQDGILNHQRASNVQEIPGSGHGLSSTNKLVKEEAKGEIVITSPLYPNAEKYKGTMFECPIISHPIE